MLHFGYGSNMCRALMRARCREARELGPAVLEGYRFLISTDGYATAVPAAGARVYGLLWRLSSRDLAALNAYERLDAGLFRARMMPVRRGAGVVTALAYFGRARTAGRPRPGYLELVLGAAREIGLPDDYVRHLARFAPSGWRAPRVPELGELT